MQVEAAEKSMSGKFTRLILDRSRGARKFRAHSDRDLYGTFTTAASDQHVIGG